MSYTARVNAQSLQLFLGICGTGRAVASSTTLDTVAFGTIYNPRPSITFQPSDVGMPIAIVGGGPVDPDMPPVNFVQGALFHTTIAAYVSPTQVTLAVAPTTGIFNTGFATIILFHPCVMASDLATVPTAFQFNSSIAPGTNDTLQFSVLNSLGGEDNPYVDRFGGLLLGQPVYLTSTDPDVGDIFGGYIDTLTTSSMPGVPNTPYCWSAQCVSYAALARRRVVPPATPQSWSAVSGDSVFRQIVLDYCTNDGVAVTTTTAPVVSLAATVGSNIGQLLDQVASLASDDTVAWYWTVDAWRNFIFTTRTATSAPWNVADGSDLFAGDTPYQQSIVQSHNQLADFAYAVGSQVLLNTLNVSLNGNSTAVTFNLPSEVGAAPTITLNSGAQTVGILGVDTGKNWYWTQGSAVITQDTGGTVLGPADVLLVVYQPLVQAVAQSPNVATLQALQAIEGTSAQYEHVSTVTAPITPANLLAMAEAYQLEYGSPATTCELYTLRPGLATGQIQTIALPDAGIPSGSYLIATVQLTTFGNVLLWQYTAFGGANIGDSLTPLVQFINRQSGTFQIIVPSVPITAAGAPTTAGNFATGHAGEGGTPALAFPATVTKGNLLVVLVTRNNIAAQTVTDSQGNTYTLAVGASNPGGFANGAAIWYTIAGATGPCSVTCTQAWFVAIAEIAGINPVTPLDSTASNPGSAPAITVGQSNNIVVTGICMDDNGTAPTVTAPEIIFGFMLGGGPASDCAGSLDVVTAGSFTSTLASTATNPIYVSASFNHAVATSPPAQTTSVQGNAAGTVTNSLGALTSGAPVIGHGGGDVTVGTKTGATTEFASVSSVGGNGTPALWQTSGDLGAGVAGQLVPSGGGTGQVLTKNSATSYDTKWATGGGGGGGNVITLGLYSALLSSGTTAGDLYICTDVPFIFVWSGTAWKPYFRGAPTSYAPAIPTPYSIPNLFLWSSADQLVGFSDGDTVFTWPNLAGGSLGGGATELSCFDAPIYKTGIVNSLPVVRFNGPDWYGFNGSNITNSRQTTIFLVISFAALSNAYTGIVTSDAGGFGWYVKSSGKTAFYSAGTDYDGSGAATVTTGTFYIFTLILGPLGIQTRIALASDFSSSSNLYQDTSTSGGRSAVGTDNSSGGRVLVGDVAEVIMYSRALTSTEYGAVESYLKTKYGL